MVFDWNMEYIRVAKRFLEQVNELLPSTDRDHVFDALKHYERNKDLEQLIADLKNVLDEPDKMEIFEFVRPLIPPNHQRQYNKLAPETPGQHTRLVRLKRRVNEKLGFAVRGGFEHEVALFVSHVEPGSQAEQHGLKVGDEIIQVNGFYLNEAIHEEAVNIIKSRDEIELKVIGIGMIPEKKNASDNLKWKYAEKKIIQAPREHSQKKGLKDAEEIKIFVNLRGVSSFGCRIISGPSHFPGIFVEGVTMGSLAEEVGLERGDQILDVNGTSFKDITHQLALVALRESKELNIILKKGAGAPFFKKKRQAPKPPQQELEEEKLLQLKVMQVDLEREHMKKHDKERDILEEDKRKKEEEELRELERLKEKQLFEIELKKKEDEKKEMEKMEQILMENQRRREEEEERRKKEAEASDRMRETKERLERQKKDRDELQKRQKKIQEQLEQQKREAEQLKQQSDSTTTNTINLWHPVETNAQSNILAGRVTMGSRKPVLLGAGPGTSLTTSNDELFNLEKFFSKEEIGGRNLKMIKLKKDLPLNIEIEGGTESPLGGKIVVAEIREDGSVYRNGGIHVGDQILMVDETKLLDVTLSQAKHILVEAERAPGMGMKIVIAPSSLKNEADEVTYF